MNSNERRVIKRYANRKLYDTVDSQYVTLEQIAELIKRGEDVVVVDKNTDADLTSVTLAQIIFEEEKQKRSFLPLAALRKVIQTGGESLTDLRHQISESAERVGRVFWRDDKTAAQGQGATDGNGEHLTVQQTKAAREWLEGLQRTVDDWQKRFDSSVHQAMETISPLAPLHREVEDLRERLDQLEQKVEGLEKTDD